MAEIRNTRSRKYYPPPVEEKPQSVGVTIMLPTRGEMKATFAYDLAQLVGFSTATMVNDGVLELSIMMGAGSVVHANRTNLAVEAITKHRPDFLFWLDDDMRFPKDALLRLLNRNKLIVGANYVTKSAQAAPVTLADITWERGVVSRRVYTEDDSTGLEEVDALGFGVTLTHVSCYEVIPYPFFQYYYDHDSRRWVGEDVYFCVEAKKRGIPVYVDHDLSHEVFHTGLFEYRMAHATAYRDALAAEGKELKDVANKLLLPTGGGGGLVEPHGSHQCDPDLHQSGRGESADGEPAVQPEADADDQRADSGPAE